MLYLHKLRSRHLKCIFLFCYHCICPLQAINKAIQKPYEEFSIGVLDIYGFEIFQVSPLTAYRYIKFIGSH